MTQDQATKLERCCNYLQDIKLKPVSMATEIDITILKRIANGFTKGIRYTTVNELYIYIQKVQAGKA